MIAAFDLTPGVLLCDERGRISAATPAARRLLERIPAAQELHSSLRALAGRCAIAGYDQQVVVGLPIKPAGGIVLTGARAGRQLAVIVEPQMSTGQAEGYGPLTPRERQVADLIAQGLPTKQIATHLQLSPLTVTAHLTAIFAKTGVSSRGELISLRNHRAASVRPRRRRTTVPSDANEGSALDLLEAGGLQRPRAREQSRR